MILSFPDGTLASVGLDGAIQAILFDPQDFDIPKDFGVLRSDISPDRKWVAVSTLRLAGSQAGGENLRLWILQLENGSPVASPPSTRAGRFLDWSPDSKHIALETIDKLGNHQLIAMPLTGGQDRLLLQTEPGEGYLTGSFSPDGESIAVIWDGSIYIARTDGQRTTLPLDTQHVGLDGWWADGTSFVVYSEYRGEDYQPGVRGPRQLTWYSTDSGLITGQLDETEAPRKEILLPGPLRIPGIHGDLVGFFVDNGAFYSFEPGTREFQRYSSMAWPFLVEEWWSSPEDFRGEASCPG